MGVLAWLIPQLLLYGLSAAGFLFPGASKGQLEPQKAVVCTSDSINFTCTLDIDQPVSDLLYHLYWTSEPVTPDPSALHTVGNKSLVLTLDNVTMADDNLNVACCVDECTFNDNVGVPVTMRVYETPVIKNFSCVLHNWIYGSLVCDWSLGVVDTKSFWLSVKLKWRIPGHSGTWFDCPDMSPESCVWNPNTTSGYDREIEILLTVNQTQCGIYLEFSSTFDSRHSVKPTPVRAFSSKVVNSTCISVSWLGAEAVQLKKYYVHLTSRWLDYQNSTIVETDSSKMQRMGHIFCGLHPHTTYTFSVKVHPATECCWSEERKITNTTTQDVPARSPQMAVGSYWWDPRDCDSPGAERLISFYWEALEETYWNGVLQRIILTFDPPLIEGRTELAADVLQKKERLRCDTAYTVTVQAGTTVGLSSPGSVLTVPAYTDVAQPEFTLEMGDTPYDDFRRDLYVSCVPSTNPEVTGYTVFYCRKEQGNCAKNSSIHSESYGASRNMTVLKLRGPEDYIYGVSTDTAQGGSGFSWLSCIYTRNVEPTKSPQNFQVTEGSDNNALDVKWHPLACESGQPFIQAYRLTYCITDRRRACRDEELEMLVPSDRTSTVLQDLQADVRYAVRVQGVTASGARGPLSEPVYATPVDHRLTAGSIVGIAFGSVFVLVLALSGLVYTLRCMKHRAKETLKKSEIKDLPISTQQFTEDDRATSDETPYNYINQAYTTCRSPTTNGHNPAAPGRQLSADSGLPEEPLTPKPEEVDPSPKIPPLPDDYHQMTFRNGSQDTTESSAESSAESSVESTGSFPEGTFDLAVIRDRVYPAGITWIAPQQDSVVFHVKAQLHPDIGQGQRTRSSHLQEKPGNVANPPVHTVPDEVGSGESVSSYIHASLLPGFSAPTSGVLLQMSDTELTPLLVRSSSKQPEHIASEMVPADDTGKNISPNTGACNQNTSAVDSADYVDNSLMNTAFLESTTNREFISSASNSTSGHSSHKQTHKNPVGRSGPTSATSAGRSVGGGTVSSSQARLGCTASGGSSTSQQVSSTTPRGVMTPDLNQAVTNNNHVIQSLNKKQDTHYSDYCEASCVHYRPLSDNSGPNTSDLVAEDIDHTDESDNDLTSERTASVDQHNSTCNHASDGHVTSTPMTSVGQHPNLSSDNTSDDGNGKYVTCEQMISIGKSSSSNVNSCSIINNGNNQDITRAHVAPISPSTNLAANSDTSSHGHNDCIAREQLQSVHQICRQSPSENTGTNGNEANIQTTKISQPTNHTSNTNTSNGNDGYVTTEQMAEISHPTIQANNINTSNHGNDGYVTSEQMAMMNMLLVEQRLQ